LGACQSVPIITAATTAYLAQSPLFQERKRVVRDKVGPVGVKVLDVLLLGLCRSKGRCVRIIVRVLVRGRELLLQLDDALKDPSVHGVEALVVVAVAAERRRAEERHEVDELLAVVDGRALVAVLAQDLLAMPVVPRTLVRIAQDGVRLLKSLEVAMGLLEVVRVLVWS